MKINVGIDLGTTYSAVATFNKTKGAVDILKNDLDKNCTPSVICIENGQVTIGEEAKELQSSGNQNTAAFYKSMMGEKDYTLYIDGKEYTPEELSSAYLKELKKNIEEANGVEIGGAVITVPAYFNESQRIATMNAGKKAGLNVLKIINEPTSAIIAYGLTGQGKKNVMVYDLGGGTFDVTIAEVDGTKVKVISTNGNHQLGGKDWDYILMRELIEKFQDEYGINIEDYPEEYKELQVKCEDLKKKLTTLPQATVTVQCEGYSGRYEISRDFFEEQTTNLLNETFILINKCFEEIGRGFGWKSLDEVVLVGGSTRMPQVKEAIIREYGKAPVTKNIDVDTIVASGAAMQAELCTANTLVLGGTGGSISQGAGNIGGLVINGSDIEDITAHSLGMLAYDPDKEDMENSIIIEKNNPYNKYFDKEYVIRDEEMDVYILQGESSNPYECELLGKYVVKGLESNKENNVTISYLYNNNGVVEVKGKLNNCVDLVVIKDNVNCTLADIIKQEKEAIEASNHNLRIVVTSKGCDDIGNILDKMQIPYENFDYINNPYDCDILFFNCCTQSVIRAEKLEKYVANGGCLYASCYADTLIKEAFPNIFNTTHSGKVCKKHVNVNDLELRDIIGKKIEVTFDTIWAELHSARGSNVILECNGKPIMVSVKYGNGMIFYTCFHNHAQTSKQEEALLQMLILKELGTITGIGVNKMGARLGIDVSKIKREMTSLR